MQPAFNSPDESMRIKLCPKVCVCVCVYIFHMFRVYMYTCIGFEIGAVLLKVIYYAFILVLIL